MAMKNYSGVWKFVDDDGNVTVLNTKTDKSLTKTDIAADAKAAGDAVRAAKTAADKANNDITVINANLPFKIVINDTNKTINFIDR